MAQKKHNNDWIVLQGVRTNNLKNIDVSIPKNKITTVTGVSGSGKSSLAFHTIYKEGQFRYIESLSSYLRQFFSLGTRPEIDYSEGLSPAIAIEQNKRVGNNRSTVGTLTEIDDYLRLLMAKVGSVFCYECGKPLKPKTTTQIVADIKARYDGSKVYLLQEIKSFTEEKDMLTRVRRNRKQVDQGSGFTRYLVGYGWDKETKSFSDSVEYFYLEDPSVPKHLMPVNVYGVFDRVTINDSTIKRLKEDSIKMLTRADKFGVMIMDGTRVESGSKKKNDDVKGYRFLLLHGYGESPEGNWFPWLKKLLEAMGHEVIVPALPDTENPNIEDQVAFVLKHGIFDEHTIIVGHSTGGVVAQKVAEAVNNKIGGMVLVGSFGEPKLKGHVSREYYETTDWIFNVEKIKGNVEQIAVLHDEKDYKVPKTQANKLKKWYGVLDIVKAEKSHFLAEEEPSILELLDKTFSLSIEEDDVVNSDSTKGKQEVQTDDVLTDQPPIIRYTDKYYCAQDDISYPEFTTQHFSSNRQEGACMQCQGIGEELLVDFDKVLDPFSPYLMAVLPWRDSRLGQAILKKLAQVYQVDENAVWSDLPEWFHEVVIHGDEEMMRINTGGGKYISMYYKGIQDVLVGQYNKGVLTVDFQAMLELKPCSVCKGARLRQESLHVVLTTEPLENENGELKNEYELKKSYNLFDLQKMSIENLVSFMKSYQKKNNAPDVLIERIMTPLVDRAGTIQDLGLGYINTSRQINSLSGGEIQRLRLAKQLGNKLTGIIYVLDEPTIGLDEKEIVKVIKAIEELKDMGNTIVVVEHNDDFIKASDWIVEIGPGAGDFGGNLEFSGPYKDFLKTETLTAQYITEKKFIEASFDHKPSSLSLNIKKASKYNLKNIDVEIKLGSFTIITGPSGAGKTTLMYHTLYSFLQDKQKFVQSFIRLKLLKQGLNWQEILQAPIMKREEYEHFEKVAVQEFYNHIGVESITGHEEIDNVMYVTQSSIGKTPRSCPATFVGVFDDIRKLYAGATEAKMLAFSAGHFSFNSAKGSCPECKGYGYKKVELQFLPDTYVPCTLCRGNRFKPEILDIKRHGKTIAEVLNMYVLDAYDFFQDIPFIANKLELMLDIGLGYLKMGQPAQTLSGGESQRLKLVKHLLTQYRGHTIYFLDEPTVGLHPSDIERLLRVLKKFLDNGDTILMIEHEKNLLQFADKVVRLDEGKISKGKTSKGK